MPDPISLATGYFLLKTATSLCLKIGSSDSDGLADKLIESAGGNFYYDLLKLGGQKAWTGFTSRVRSEYNSNQPLNHDLQKAIRKSQIEATISACESCFGDLRYHDKTLLEKLTNSLYLNDDERWLKKVVQSLTKNLAEIKDKDYVPPTLTDDIDVLNIADNKNAALTNEHLETLTTSLKEQTVIELRFATPPSHAQKHIAESLENKIHNGWTKNFQGETIFVDWYKLLCDRFNEEYKENPRVNAALQKAFFQDLKSDIAKRFTNVSENHFDELGDKMLTKLERIEGKQDRLYDFVKLFSDETDKKLTEALIALQTSVHEINLFTERKTEETQAVVRDAKSEIISEFNTHNARLIGHIDKKLTSQSEEIQFRFDEALQKTAGFRRNILTKRDLSIIEKILGNRRIESFDRIYGKLTPQEEFFVSLKRRYTERYFNKLDGRFEITLMASDDLESEVRTEYTGIYEGHGHLNEAFEYMRNAFNDANRLLVIGEPGVGKTVLLLKFANDLSNRSVEQLNSHPELRLDDIKAPIPVIFNLASWSEDYESFSDWLIAMLKTGEGLSESFADELLRKKKIFLLLDGLDELAKNQTSAAAAIRAKCFDSIVGFLRGGQKAVICCRADEYWQIRADIGQNDEQQRHKIPEVLVKTLDINQIEDALHRASQTEVDKESALNILRLLDQKNSSVFLKVLSIPFYFTTALEVFDSSVIGERNIPESEEALKAYLVGKLIAEKLEMSPPEPKRFKYGSSFKWLKWLAKSLRKKDKVTFELADLQPNDFAKLWIFRLFLGFAVYLLLFITFHVTWAWGNFLVLMQSDSQSLSIFLSSSTILETFIKFILSILLFLVFIPFILPICLIYSFRVKTILTEDMSRFSIKPLLKLRSWGDILISTLLYSVMPLTLLIFSVSLFDKNSKIDPSANKAKAAITAIFISIIISIMIQRILSNCRVVTEFTTLKYSYQRLKAGIFYNLLLWLLTFVFFGTSSYFWLSALEQNIAFPGFSILEFLFGSLPLILFFALINTPLAKHFVLRCFLKTIRVLPLRLVSFLTNTTKARILEKDGGFWRFRHQELQDYFADLP